jgi:Glutathione S-transferase, C-terminal domain
MVDNLEEDEKPTIQGGFTDTWLTRRRTWDEKARGLKVSPLGSVADELRALASEFYAPISELVTSNAGKRFLFSDSPSSLDVVIYGHLILHLLPVLPDPTLRTTLTQSHPQLVEYLQRCHSYFQSQLSTMATIKDSQSLGTLFKGWGHEKGKRMEDLVGLGALVGAVLAYALWNSLRKS